MSTELFLRNMREGVYRAIEELYPASDRILMLTWPNVERFIEGWQKGLPLHALVSKVAESYAGNIVMYLDT